MKFLTAFTKGNKNLLKIALDDGTEKWATTTSAVLEYAKKNFKAKDDVKLEMTDKNGQYNITKISKIDNSSYTTTKETPTETPKSEGFKCEDCGKVLKDGKYKKCFDCNKKTPEKKIGSQRNDIVGQSIEKQAMMKASAHAVATAMQGQIGDVNALADMIITVYERLYKKLSE
jgi:hypothetical protein